MKPKTKIEVRMCELAALLPAPPQQFVDDYFARFRDYGYIIPRRGHKSEVWCQCCGHREMTNGRLHELVDYECPNCGRRLELSEYEARDKSSHIEQHWCSLVDTFAGLQLARTFQLERINIAGTPTRCICREIYQNWAAPNGREVITSRPYTRSVFGGEKFDFEKPFAIARHNASWTGCYAFGDMFDVTRNDVWSKYVLLPDLKRDGFDAKFVTHCIRHGQNFVKIAAAMSTDKSFVTMLKVGYQRLALHIIEHGVKMPPHVVKILHRNHYEIKDIAMYCDYMRDCVFCGVDTHNAFYVCPTDLREAHQRMMRKRGKIEGERKLQRQRQQVIKEEPQYQKMRAAFFGLEFVAGDIRVFTAPSVADVLQEGCAMHHCVFDNGYYKNEQSLIMFARSVSTGERLETVEVNLRNFSIAQSRGLQNKMTPQHDSIVTLVKTNMNAIRSCARRQRVSCA